MIGIEEEIRKKGRYGGFVTGDNIAQVASQTLQNMYVIDSAAKHEIYRPLLGFDKEEIVRMAKQIGTYEISTRDYADCTPYADSCVFFVGKHPATRADLKKVETMEDKISLKTLAKGPLQQTLTLG